MSVILPHVGVILTSEPLVVSNVASHQPSNGAAMPQPCHIGFGPSSQLCMGKPVFMVFSGDLGWRRDRQLTHLGLRFVHPSEMYVLLLLIYGRVH
jgi:hypothetical protein